MLRSLDVVSRSDKRREMRAVSTGCDREKAVRAEQDQPWKWRCFPNTKGEDELKKCIQDYFTKRLKNINFLKNKYESFFQLQCFPQGQMVNRNPGASFPTHLVQDRITFLCRFTNNDLATPLARFLYWQCCAEPLFMFAQPLALSESILLHDFVSYCSPAMRKKSQFIKVSSTKH